MGVTIREAEADDTTAALAAIEWLFDPPGSRPPAWDPAAARETLHAIADAEAATLLLAEDGDALVGICSVTLDLRSIRYGQRAWVEDLAVRNDQRSAGVGKALLDHAKDWARTHGATHLELDSSDARRDAHRFYEREDPSWTSRCFAWTL